MSVRDHDGWIVVYEDGYVLGECFGHVRLFNNAAEARKAADAEGLANGTYMVRPCMYDSPSSDD